MDLFPHELTNRKIQINSYQSSPTGVNICYFLISKLHKQSFDATTTTTTATSY